MQQDGFEIICEDFFQQEPQDVNIVPPPYLDGMTDIRRVEYYYSLIKKAQRRKDRLKALTYTFYFGEMIEIDDNIRKIAKKKLTTYYFQTAIRIFYMFEVIPDQIMRTKYTSLAMIRRLIAQKYYLLLPDY